MTVLSLRCGTGGEGPALGLQSVEMIKEPTAIKGDEPHVWDNVEQIAAHLGINTADCYL